MKNYILLLLLATFGIQAQTYQNPIYGTVKLKNNTQSTTATKVNVQETDGTINWQFIKDFQNNKPYFSTGLLKNGLLTINADNTKFDLSAGIGVYSDFSDPENVTSKVFNFPAFNAVSSPYLATSNITYVAVNYNGGSPVLVMQASKFSNTQLRDLVVVGAVVHSNFTTINTINNISSPSNDVGNSVADLFNFLGAKNQEGNVYSANGANLQLNKSAGVMFKYGANFHVNAKNPHNVSLPEQLSLTFRYRLRGGFEGTDRINIDTDNYDLNNVLTTVPPAKPYQIQTIFIPQTGQTRLQYGQDTYSTLADAIAAINTRKFVTESNLASQFVKVAYLVVKKGATSLNVAADADIRQATQFDGTASGGVALTYQSIIDALGFTPENVVNKVTDISTGANNTTYPTSLAVKTYADNLVVGMLNDRGSWDASVNLFPTTGGSGTAGAIRKGDMWYISVAGTLGGKAVNVGDSFRALVNSPAQVASNWSVLEANIGYVPENVANKSDNYTVSSTTTYPNTKALVDGLGTKISGSGTSGYLPKWTGSGTQGNSLIYDSGVGISFGGSTVFGGYEFLIPAFGNNTIYLGVSDGVQNPRAFISQQSSSGNQDVHFGSAFSSGNRSANWIYESGNVIVATGTVTASLATVSTELPTWGQTTTSPAFTGTPTAPTAAVGTNTTQIATTAFVQTNSRPYKVYTALLSQTGTNAPVATVLENTLGGTVVWSRNSSGAYDGTLASAFPVNKVFCNAGGSQNSAGSKILIFRVDSSTIRITTSNASLVLADDILTAASCVEIRVYN